MAILLHDSDLIIPAPPKTVENLTNHDILLGQLIPPIERIRLFSPQQYEDFINEWLHGYLMGKSEYVDVRQSGGAGDMGRDIVAYVDKLSPYGLWDNFQCKHYRTALAPSDIWVELGKLCHFTFINMYTIPRKYYFVAPQGVGSKLGTLLEKPEQLREELIKNWDNYCLKNITTTKNISLTGNFKSYVESFDFSIVSHFPTLTIIEQHSQTRWHAYRFGGGLTKRRPTPPSPPNEIGKGESLYVKYLLEAYEDHLNTTITTIADLQHFPKIIKHFNRQREHFYRAESLNQFARDTLPDNSSFEELKNEIYSGVIDVSEDEHNDGFECVKETIQAARLLQLTKINPLSDHIHTDDRSGICHHLANEEKLRWVTPDE